MKRREAVEKEDERGHMIYDLFQDHIRRSGRSDAHELT